MTKTVLPNAIEVKNLVKKYKKAETNAVDGISFEVKQGEFFTFLGPNGAGKTTTISMLTTTLAKTSGDVLISGYDLDKESSKVRSSIGVIFQNPSLDLNLTAEENVRFHAILYGLYPFRPLYSLMPQEYKDELSRLAKILGIEKEIFKPVKGFSGGMKRKLEIVRSLIHKPKVLFLDEPTSGLDPEARKNLWEYLLDFRKKQKTTIFLTTHYLEEAEDSDRVCVINKGKIVAMGTPAMIKKELVDVYMEINAKSKTELQKELDKLKIEYTGKGPFKIDLEKYNAQEVIKKLKTKLSEIDIHKPTLEEAYLEIINNGNTK